MPSGDPFNRLARYLGDRLCVLFLLAVALTAYEVVMRYAFNAPTVWVHETTIALSATAFVLAGAYTLERRDHIRIGIVFDHLPPRLRRWLSVVNTALALVFLIGLGWGAAGQAAKSISVLETTGTASNLPIPLVLKSVIVLGVALMALQTLVHLWGHLRGDTAEQAPPQVPAQVAPQAPFPSQGAGPR